MSVSSCRHHCVSWPTSASNDQPELIHSLYLKLDMHNANLVQLHLEEERTILWLKDSPNISLTKLSVKFKPKFGLSKLLFSSLKNAGVIITKGHASSSSKICLSLSRWWRFDSIEYRTIHKLPMIVWYNWKVAIQCNEPLVDGNHGEGKVSTVDSIFYQV